LHKWISGQKQGTILIKKIPDVLPENPPITIAMEYCLSTGKTSGTIGTNAKMINTRSMGDSPSAPFTKKL
jgi:hypothetical protein